MSKARFKYPRCHSHKLNKFRDNKEGNQNINVKVVLNVTK